MAFKSLKSFATNLAMPHVGELFNSFTNAGSQKSAGKVAAQLLNKGPFDIPDSPAQSLTSNPLVFSTVQYPLDLGSNELGHYMIFESGFLTYEPQQNTMFEASYQGPKEKITGKIPKGSISTAAIALYMPPVIKVGYSQSYDNDTETGVAGDVQEALTAAKSADDVASAILGGARGLSGSAVRNAGQALGEFISFAGIGDPVKFTLKRFGTAVNPRNEAFYNSPNQRTFSYTFDFWPRNKDEARAVENIITIFKTNSAPGLTEGSGQFKIPNYFKISYMHKGEQNEHLHKIGAAYCTEVDVDYTPDGQFTTFGDGQPVHTKLTVNFIEDRIITKRDIEAGA